MAASAIGRRRAFPTHCGGRDFAILFIADFLSRDIPVFGILFFTFVRY
jgi:hypothetical protein